MFYCLTFTDFGSFSIGPRRRLSGSTPKLIFIGNECGTSFELLYISSSVSFSSSLSFLSSSEISISSPYFSTGFSGSSSRSNKESISKINNS